MPGSLNKLLVVVIIVSFICTLPVIYNRVAVEHGAEGVELIMDLPEAEALARWCGQDIEAVLGQMRDHGLTSVGVAEMSLRRLHDTGRVTLVTGSEVKARSLVAPLDSPLREIVDYVSSDGYTYMICDDADLAADVVARAQHRDNLVFVSEFIVDSGYHVIEFGGSSEALLTAGLGFGQHDFQMVSDLGLNVVPRPHNIRGMTSGEVEQLVDEFGSDATIAIAHGGEMIGFAEQLASYGKALAEGNIALGLVESYEQRGFIFQRGWEPAAEAANWQVVRVYSMPDDLDRLGQQGLSDNLVRAVVERNIRGLYLRPLVGRDVYGLELAETLSLIKDVSNRLTAHGFNVGIARPFARVNNELWALLAAVVGVYAGCAYIVNRIVSIRPWLAFIGVAASIAGFLWGYGIAPVAIRQLVALVTTIVFPVMAIDVGWQLVRNRWTGVSAWVRAVVGLVTASFVSIIGACFLTVLLGDSLFMVEARYFRGVKMSYVLPVIIAIILFTGDKAESVSGLCRRMWSQGLEFIQKRVSVCDLAVIVGVAVVLYVYVGRSGHEAGVSAGSIELTIRDVLERVLAIRPRFKEFMLGQPAFIIGAGLWQLRVFKTKALWLIIALTAQVSIINSFAHLRTPFMVSLVRTGHGVWLGAIIGLVAAVVIYKWWQVSSMRGGGLHNEARGD